jgi:hypothetical protein
MAVQNLNTQFGEAQANVNLGRRRAVAQAAHLEVREVLNRAQPLLDHGLRDVLIGSYARDTGIWPGKDVDIFGKLTLESILTIRPEDAYQLFLGPLEGKYAGRVTPQPRSMKIDFGTGDRAPALEFLKARDASRTDAFEFSVDVVPAVRWDERWAIPNNDRKLWLRTTAADRWVLTDPEVLTELTTTRNGDVVIAGQGAFVPTAKAIKQIRRHHLGDARPGGLYFEFALHEGFATGQITGNSWADVTAAALTFLADRLRTAITNPICDPVLLQRYEPAPDAAQLATASQTFGQLASMANRALTADKCPAAAAWRQIFGSNGNGGTDSVFPLPAGCRADGSVMVAGVVPNVRRGSDEARGFGVA